MEQLCIKNGHECAANKKSGVQPVCNSADTAPCSAERLAVTACSSSSMQHDVEAGSLPHVAFHAAKALHEGLQVQQAQFNL